MAQSRQEQVLPASQPIPKPREGEGDKLSMSSFSAYLISHPSHAATSRGSADEEHLKKIFPHGNLMSQKPTSLVFIFQRKLRQESFTHFPRITQLVNGGVSLVLFS